MNFHKWKFKRLKKKWNSPDFSDKWNSPDFSDRENYVNLSRVHGQMPLWMYEIKKNHSLYNETSPKYTDEHSENEG